MFLNKSPKFHETAFVFVSLEPTICKIVYLDISVFFAYYDELLFNNFSGFVEAKNIKEYVENRTLFAHSGKGAAFKKALADIEEYISGKKVNTFFS